MKFELLNTHIYCYPGNKDNDIEKIISKIMSAEYRSDRLRSQADNETIRG